MNDRAKRNPTPAAADADPAAATTPATAPKAPDTRRAKRGWEGAVLRAMGAKDFTLTVTDTRPVTDHLHRITVDDGGLLATHPPYPTQWIRLWFPGTAKPHQRAFTLVDPDPASGTFALEFAVHDGPAPTWALAARPGDRIEATVQGSDYRRPEGPQAPDAPEWTAWLVGDLASTPALRGLVPDLLAHPRRPEVHVILEHRHDDDAPLDLPAGVPVTRIARGDGTALPSAVMAAVLDTALPTGSPSPHDWFWIAAEAATTRALVSALRARGVDKTRIDALGYWQAQPRHPK